MDWNWFFSSVAQSVAAIVGIFAAFLITKIINNQSEFARKKVRIQELLNNSTRYRDALSQRYFDWYNERTLEDDLDSLRTQLEEEKIRLPEEYYEDCGFSPFILRNEVLRKIQEEVAAHRVDNNSTDVSNMAMHVLRLEAMADRRPKLEHERELINTLNVDVKQNIRLVSHFLKEIEANPESSNLVSMSVLGALILFFTGVIYPLSFLPVDNSTSVSVSISLFIRGLLSPRGWILIPVSTIFTAIMIVFGQINLSLKYSSDDVNMLREFSLIGSYSKYLAIMDTNIQDVKTRREKEPPLSGT